MGMASCRKCLPQAKGATSMVPVLHCHAATQLRHRHACRAPARRGGCCCGAFLAVDLEQFADIFQVELGQVGAGALAHAALLARYLVVAAVLGRLGRG